MSLNPNLLALSFIATLGLSAGISLARLTVKTFKARNMMSAAYHAIVAVFSLGIAVVSMMVMSPILQAEWAKTEWLVQADIITVVACLCMCIIGGTGGVFGAFPLPFFPPLPLCDKAGRCPVRASGVRRVLFAGGDSFPVHVRKTGVACSRVGRSGWLSGRPGRLSCVSGLFSGATHPKL